MYIPVCIRIHTRMYTCMVHARHCVLLIFFVSETVLSCVSLIFDFVSMSAVENHKSLTGRPISTSAVLHIVEYSSYNLRALAVNLQPHC